jgi:hypothetical protein
VGIVVTKTLIFHAYYSVQSKLLGHAPTTIPPTQCSLIIVSISALTITYHPQEQWLDLRRFTSSGELISQTQVYNPKRSVSVYFDVCTTIAKNIVYQSQGVGKPKEAWPERKLVYQMTNTCARDTALGHVMVQAGATDHTGLVFHDLPGKKHNPPSSFKKEWQPLTAPLASVTM